MLFVAYVVISCVFLFSYNPYQQSVYLTSANMVSASIYGAASNVSDYFSLRDINEDLQQRNSTLEKRVLELEALITLYQEKEITLDIEADTSLSRFDFILAHVINNSIIISHNPYKAPQRHTLTEPFLFWQSVRFPVFRPAKIFFAPTIKKAYRFPLPDILIQILSRAYIHSLVHLARIGTDHLSPELSGKPDGKCCLSACRRSYNT